MVNVSPSQRRSREYLIRKMQNGETNSARGWLIPSKKFRLSYYKKYFHSHSLKALFLLYIQCYKQQFQFTCKGIEGGQNPSLTKEQPVQAYHAASLLLSNHAHATKSRERLFIWPMRLIVRSLFYLIRGNQACPGYCSTALCLL